MLTILHTIRLINSPQSCPQTTPACRHPLNIYTRVFFFLSYTCDVRCDVSMTSCKIVQILVQIATFTVAVLGKHVGVIEDEFYLTREKFKLL